MRNKPTINLRPNIGVGLIIKRKTGVIIANQTGGYSCNYSFVEGLYIPLALNVHPLIDKYFVHQDGRYKGECSIQNGGLDQAAATYMDSILTGEYQSLVINVDPSKLQQSEEAWLHVVINNYGKDQEFDAITGFGQCLGVLTWENSD